MNRRGAVECRRRGSNVELIADTLGDGFEFLLDDFMIRSEQLKCFC